MIEVSQLLGGLLLFVLLPLWTIAGFADWLCHRATRIEHTSGIKESLMHSVMGIQVGIPVFLALHFEVNVLVLLACFAGWVLHELIAHWDVHYAADVRRISVWEMHAHSYLATLPSFSLASLVVIKWPVFVQLISLDWSGEMSLVPAIVPPGGDNYIAVYFLAVFVLNVLPYAEENLRCLRHWLQQQRWAI